MTNTTGTKPASAKRLVPLLILGASIVTGVVIGAEQSKPIGVDSGIIHELSHAREVASRERVYQTPMEAMPSVDYVDEPGGRESASQLVTLGYFESVAPGRGFSWGLTDSGEEIRHTLAYGADAAWVNTIHVSVRVAEVIDAEADVATETGDVVVVGIALSEPVTIDSAESELRGLGRVVLFLVSDAAVWDYEPDLWGVLEDGGFIGVVSNDGEIEFPILNEEGEGIRGLQGLDIATLRNAATP